eukprot:TRINITY_DN22588_c0_g1_i2.p1 TRINITY_DN22588_c0_g1~~TRINITY_DN22588_c0_g1_i2.p1  ORF type:complete len:1213 (+),score=350.78 TRINITY_DN22588_c0_g1_i2:70-3708(+)
MGTACSSSACDCCSQARSNITEEYTQGSAAMSSTEGTGKDKDQEFLNKFSRQNAALGAEVTMKMTKMHALIVGCSGVATEIAKNLILQGLGGITLVDTKSAQLQDLGTNFFLTEKDVGKPLAATLVPKFKELNPFCNIKAVEEVTPELVKQHAVMIVCQSMPLHELLKWNDFCRTNTPKAIAFIYVRHGGVFGNLFVDFGPTHVVQDSNGQAPMIRLVESIESGPEALVRLSVPDGQAPGSLPEGGYVEFSDVTGCDGISTHQEASPCGDMVTAWKVNTKPSDPVNTIRIGDTSSFPAYVSGGQVTEKKVGVPYPFASLKDALKDPGMPFDKMVGTDMINFGSEWQMHVALHAALVIEADTGKPISGDADVPAVIAKAKELIASKTTDVEIDVDEELFAKYLRHFSTPIQPMCAFLGGIVAQEVVKIAGKFTPIPGFLHFHCMEALPSEIPSDIAPTGSRYDALASIYGHAFVKKLGSLKYFMVGCGALGCEFLKNFALNGVCCGEDGLLTVTDADRIELSNLTRQFLFREHNVGQPKSVAASAMAKEMNPGMKVKALEMFVGAKTEDTFNDDFWMGQDGICNALDNMEARFYVDDQCVKYEKSLLESGTMGPAGNVDPVVPHKTQTYRDGGQADEGGGIPMCTLRNFPHLPDHCIEWARDQFELLFVKSIKQLQKFKEDPDGFISERASSTDDAQAIFEVRGLLSLLTAAENPSIKSAGQMTFDYFHLLFRDKITDLVTAFPENSRVIDPDTKQDKGAFWSGHKRFPQVATFDANNETHWRFFVDSTCLFGAVLGAIPQKKEGDDDYCKEYRSQEWAAKLSKELTVPEYVAGGVNTEGDASAGGGGKVDSKEALKGLLARLEAFKSKLATLGTKLEEADFEKDDDFNFHIDFITQCANLRANNYHIANSDFQKVKLVAGKIVPAIATTTAAVCGLVLFELFKLVMGKDAGAFRTRQIGLAVNTYTSFEAQEPKTFSSGVEKKVPKAEELPADAFDEKGIMKPEYILEEAYAAYPEKHSVWNKLRVPSGTLTLQGLKDWLKTEHKLEMKNWGFVLGWKKDEDEGKEVKVPFSSQIYPIPVSIDASLLPPLEDAQGDAMKKIMGNAAIPAPQKMKYLNEWKNAQKAGKLPSSSGAEISMETPLKDILALMEKKAAAALKEGTINPKWGTAISGLAGRRFWVIPADQTPSCNTTPADGSEPVDVRFMSRLEIPL